jgi:uncharacterized protein YoaH (UPF0181 family)
VFAILQIFDSKKQKQVSLEEIEELVEKGISSIENAAQ